MKPKTNQPRGTTLHELLAAMALLSSIVTLVVPMSVKIMRLRQVYFERMVAVEELANQMEQLTLVPADHLVRAIQAVSVSPTAAIYLNDAKLSATTEPSESGVVLRVSLQWQDRLGNRPPPVSLTTWLFPGSSHLTTEGNGP